MSKLTFTVQAFNARSGERREVTKDSLTSAEWLFDYLNAKGWVAYNIRVGRSK